MGGNQFGLHPAATDLHNLFQDGKVAFVHAAGLDTSSRSHFDNQAQMELGTPGDGGTTDGWLTRHFLTSPGLPADTPMVQRIAVSSTIQSAWLADTNVVAFANRDDFLFNTGPSAWRDAQKTSLRNILDLHADVDPRYAQGLVSLDASGFIEQNMPTLSSYVPANGAVYPSGSFGDSLKLTAQLIKLDMGLRAATLDLGGWDTHNGQGTAADGQFFWEKIQELSQALAAFYTDLDGVGPNAYAGRTTVAVMSEFGRRFRENNDAGTDHGHGGVITVDGRTGRRRPLRQLAGARQRPALRRRRPRHHHRLPPRALRDRRQPAREPQLAAGLPRLRRLLAAGARPPDPVQRRLRERQHGELECHGSLTGRAEISAIHSTPPIPTGASAREISCPRSSTSCRST